MTNTVSDTSATSPKPTLFARFLAWWNGPTQPQNHPTKYIPQEGKYVEEIARYLYRHDGNQNLPSNRSWENLNPYWQERYCDLAHGLLVRLGRLED